MNKADKDLLQIKVSKDSFSKFMRGLVFAFYAWFVITTALWTNYHGNWQNYYPATSHMVVIIVVILFGIYIAHFLNLRVGLYILLGIVGIVITLDRVSNQLPIIDTIFTFLLRFSADPESEFFEFNTAKVLIGDSFYEALLIWVILDVPFQIWENKKQSQWETAVKNVYHTLSAQIMILSLSGQDIKSVYIQKNYIHCNQIEALCKKRIKSYTRRKPFFKNTIQPDLQIKAQYERLLFLLQSIRSNPEQLNGYEYLKLLYEAEAIFRRSTIISYDTK